MSCADIIGERRTKCPCFTRKQPCTSSCSCHKCGNGYGNRENQAFPSPTTPEKKRTAKCTSSPSSLKRKRSTLFHKENEMDVKQGSWTLQETCIIESVESFLLSTTILPSVHNVTLLYNFVINSSTASRKKLRANQKTTEQVRGKLEFSHRRQEALRRMLYGIASIWKPCGHTGLFFYDNITAMFISKGYNALGSGHYLWFGGGGAGIFCDNTFKIHMTPLGKKENLIDPPWKKDKNFHVPPPFCNMFSPSIWVL